MFQNIYLIHKETINNNSLTINIKENADIMQINGTVVMPLKPIPTEGRILMDSLFNGLFANVKMDYGSIHLIIEYIVYDIKKKEIIINGEFLRHELIPIDDASVMISFFQFFELARSEYQITIVIKDIRNIKGDLYKVCKLPFTWNIHMFTQYIILLLSFFF